MTEDLTYQVAAIDLVALIEKDVQLDLVARTNGGEWAGPCPFCGEGVDRFRVWPKHPGGRGRWWCRRCERSGDAIDYVQARQQVGFREALEILRIERGTVATAPARERPRPGPAVPDVAPPSEQWQERARAFVEYAQGKLWGAGGELALLYLMAERGLREETIREWGLGYNPQALYDRDVGRWGVGGKAVYLSPGIVIPCEIDGALWYVQIRRPYAPGSGVDPLAECLGYAADFAPEHKYFAVKGGVSQALFGADGLQGRPLLLFCEGEFDAMLALQELGDLVDVVTLGGAKKANHGLPGRWLLRLAPFKVILAAYDADGSGRDGAAMLASHSRRVRPVAVPAGGDIVGFWQQGGNLRAWLLGELARLGLSAGECGEEEAGGERGFVAPPADDRGAGEKDWGR